MSSNRKMVRSVFAVMLIVLSVGYGVVSAQDATPVAASAECVTFTAPGATDGESPIIDNQVDGETNDDAQIQAQATDDQVDGETNDDGQVQAQATDDQADGETNDDAHAQATDDQADGETNDDAQATDIETNDPGQDPTYTGSVTVDESTLSGLSSTDRCAKLVSLASITSDQAKAAAPTGSTIVQVDLDVENGFLVYSLQLDNETELTVDAGTGAVIATQAASSDSSESETPAATGASSSTSPAAVTAASV